MAWQRYGLLNHSIGTVTFATDGTGDITCGVSHGLVAGEQVRFTTTGLLPPDLLVASVTGDNDLWYVLAAGLTGTKFRISRVLAGSTITYSTAGIGVHTVWNSTLFATIEPRGITWRLPGQTSATPQVVFGSPAPELTTAVGGASIYGTILTFASAHGRSAGDPVRFEGAQLPAPLNPTTTYYVLASGLTQLMVATTIGGTPIDFGDPRADTWMYNAPAGLPLPIGLNDVMLQPVLPLMYRNAPSNAVFVGNGFSGWFSDFTVCFNNLFQVGAVEQLSTSDAAARLAGFNRTRTESLSTSDLSVVGFDRYAAESLSTSDAPIVIRALLRQAIEALTTADAAVDVRGPVRTAAEALSTADAVTRTLILLRIALENLTISEAASVIAPRSRAAAELLTILDHASPIPGPSLFATESLSTADAAKRSLVLHRAVAETLQASLSAARIVALMRKAQEHIRWRDVPKAHGPFKRRAFEFLSTSDASVAAVRKFRSAAESLATSDAATRIESLIRGASETLSLVDAILVGRLYLRLVAHSLVIADAAQVSDVHNLIRTASEILFIAEFVTSTKNFPPPEEWNYYLDLRTGNFPTQSAIELPDAASILTGPASQSTISGPDAQSALAGNAAGSGLRYINP